MYDYIVKVFGKTRTIKQTVGPQDVIESQLEQVRENNEWKRMDNIRNVVSAALIVIVAAIFASCV